MPANLPVLPLQAPTRAQGAYGRHHRWTCNGRARLSSSGGGHDSSWKRVGWTVLTERVKRSRTPIGFSRRTTTRPGWAYPSSVSVCNLKAKEGTSPRCGNPPLGDSTLCFWLVLLVRLQLQRRNTNASEGMVTQTTCAVFAGENLVGMHVERLGVEVVDGVAMYLSASQYSVPKLQEHFGGNFCWPVVVSNKRGSYPLTMCPCKGQLGHEPDGHMHLIDKHKKASFLRLANTFRLCQGDTGFRDPCSTASLLPCSSPRGRWACVRSNSSGGPTPCPVDLGWHR